MGCGTVPADGGGVFHLVFGGRKWGISVFTGKSNGMSFRKRSETDYFLLLSLPSSHETPGEFGRD